MRTSPTLAAVLLAVVAVSAVPATGSVAADPDAAVVARYPSDGEMVEETVVSPSDVASVEAPDDSGRGYSFEVTLTDEAATAFANTLVEAGFTDEGVGSCPPAEGRNDEGHCLLTVVDGEAVSALGVAPGFADVVASGEFEADTRFQIRATNESTTERVAQAFGAEIGNETATTTTTTLTTALDDETTSGDETADADTSTQTTAESTTETTTEQGAGDSTGGTAPGFGVVAAVAAVAGGGLAAARSD